jgi:DNA-directed RNA polymerase
MTVSMSNRKMKSKQIKTSLIKKAKPISILVPTDQIDYKNIKTGLMPNFIHSLDASNIHILIQNIVKLNLKDINLYTIHDCFASDYKNIAIIELLVKHSFIQLYFKQNYLEFVHNSFLKQIESYTQIFTEERFVDNTTHKYKYICIPNDKQVKRKKSHTQKWNLLPLNEIIYIPQLPEYK